MGGVVIAAGVQRLEEDVELGPDSFDRRRCGADDTSSTLCPSARWARSGPDGRAELSSTAAIRTSTEWSAQT
jgi:hypothetical protein